MAQISARTAKWAKWSVVPAALLISGAAVSQASYSAYSSTVATPSSNWTSGTVKIDSDAPATALFTATKLKPGSTEEKCITVTSSGSLASTVKLYATAPATTNALSSHIDLTVTQGTLAGADCKAFKPLATGPDVYTGTLAAFGAASTFATGKGNWAPTGAAAETRVYKIVYTLNPLAPNDTQGGTASVGFTWEAQNS
jgi:hypothetical protein